MNSPVAGDPPARQSSVFKNWLSLFGAMVMVGSVFSFALLLLLDAMAHSANPYIGLLTYIVAPGFLCAGAFMAILGAFLRHRRITKSVGTLPKVNIDLTRPRDRKIFGVFITCAVLFLLASASGSYQTYHYTESVQFCGQACHEVMKPEMVTYLNSPHARVGCSECHVGKGASSYFKAKVSGTHQLLGVISGKYPRPVPTPVKNLRPAQETCEECHWPKKFVGNLDRTYESFLGDATNTPYTIRLLLKVGGGDPTHGPVGGIHWHMNVGAKIQYFPADEARQNIPFVRMTDNQGVVTEFRTPRFTNTVDESKLRTMDCMDCHNRPAHRYSAPTTAVELAMALGHIDRGLPFVKTNAVWALTRKYTNEAEATQGIATFLSQKYPGSPAVPQLISTVQELYNENFFPGMNASWQSYPDNIGHKDWPGCFRCHDGIHKTPDGKRSIQSSDCNSCHTILTQGQGAELKLLTPDGQKFKHPGDEVDGACADCHNGVL
jgi:nitrate/TMAO reductase-like tetraheme cytochrome c subunit